MYRFTKEQKELRDFGFIYPKLFISENDRIYFKENDLLIYDFWRQNKD